MIGRTTLVIGAIALGLAGSVAAQEAQEQCCKGQGQKKGHHGGGMKGGMGMDADHAQDMEMFHYLLDHRDVIRREVVELPNGVETVTESDDPEVAAKIREHVASMYRRIEEDRPIHRRDPLFAEIFDHADQIEMTMEKTEHGLRVVETSEDPYVAKLIQSHAEVVSQFLVNGRMEMRKNHELPEKDER